MLAEKNNYINHAYQHLQVISQNKEKRLEYEAREKAILDHNQLIFEAKQSGKEEGRKEGIQEGRKKGIEEGRKEGIQAMILDNLEENLPKERILTKLQKRFHLTEEQAEEYYLASVINDSLE